MMRIPFSSIYCHVYHPSPPVGQSEERSDGSSSGSGAGSGPGESSALPLSDITSPGIRHFGFLFVWFCFFSDDHFDQFIVNHRSWPHWSLVTFWLYLSENVYLNSQFLKLALSDVTKDFDASVIHKRHQSHILASGKSSVFLLEAVNGQQNVSFVLFL